MNNDKKVLLSQQELRRTRKTLAELILVVDTALTEVDKVFKEPVSRERGEKIGHIWNMLQVAADAARLALPTSVEKAALSKVEINNGDPTKN